jgi:hypothetical protein
MPVTDNKTLIIRAMEAVSTSETSVNFCDTIRRNIPENRHHTRRHENLESYPEYPFSKPNKCIRFLNYYNYSIVCIDGIIGLCPSQVCYLWSLVNEIDAKIFSQCIVWLRVWVAKQKRFYFGNLFHGSKVMNLFIGNNRRPVWCINLKRRLFYSRLWSIDAFGVEMG